MILYHGTNLDIQSIDMALCRPYKDFGRGFILLSCLSRHRKSIFVSYRKSYKIFEESWCFS